tara:strand:- start:410 stop:1426 length:1017 start_codon:yes stop_codon:yes gene_type:complete
MGMLGNQLAAGTALTIANDSFNGDGSTTAFTLSHAVSNVNDIEVLVDNVQQSPYDSSYSVSGTTLTFSGAPSAGTNNIYVIYNASKHITTSQVIPSDGSVTSSKLDTNISISGSLTTAGITSTSRHDVNFNGSATQAFKYTDTGGGNLASFGQFYNPSNALIGNIQNANNDGIHLNVKNGSVVFSNVGYTAANALDDYEEGFYTPTYGATGGYGNQTYTLRTGVYTKIGRMVKVWVDMSLSANSSQAGIPLVTLPFASASSSAFGTDSTGSQRYDMGSWTPWAVDSGISSGPTTGWIANGDSHMVMYRWSGNYNYGHTNLPLNATGRISGTIWYTAAF